MKSRLQQWINRIEIIDSILGLIGVLFVIGGALFYQIVWKEQPCPLCLLQRVAFINIGLALLMNLRYGNKGWHWALVILSSCTGAAVSLRQMLLHITSPEGFGSAVFGLHMYTWCFLLFVFAIVGSAFMLLIYPEVVNQGE